MKRIALLAMVVALLAPPVAAQETGTWITVYYQDLALVRQAREIPIQCKLALGKPGGNACAVCLEMSFLENP